MKSDTFARIWSKSFASDSEHVITDFACSTAAKRLLSHAVCMKMGGQKAPFPLPWDTDDRIAPLPDQLFTGISTHKKLLVPAASTKAPCNNVRTFSSVITHCQGEQNGLF